MSLSAWPRPHVSYFLLQVLPQRLSSACNFSLGAFWQALFPDDMQHACRYGVHSMSEAPLIKPLTPLGDFITRLGRPPSKAAMNTYFMRLREQGWDVSHTVKKALQCGASLDKEVRCCAVPCSAVLCCAELCRAVPCCAVP